jgi:hypothetical protein
MKKLSDIQLEMKQDEQLSTQDLTFLKGGLRRDDKRRARPGGGTTTTSPSYYRQYDY